MQGRSSTEYKKVEYVSSTRVIPGVSHIHQRHNKIFSVHFCSYGAFSLVFLFISKGRTIRASNAEIFVFDPSFKFLIPYNTVAFYRMVRGAILKR